MLVLAASGIAVEPGVTAAVNLAAGSIIAVVAYQPPTLNPGDTFNIQTPTGSPNYETTVAAPPKASPPPVVKPEG